MLTEFRIVDRPLSTDQRVSKVLTQAVVKALQDTAKTGKAILVSCQGVKQSTIRSSVQTRFYRAGFTLHVKAEHGGTHVIMWLTKKADS